MDLLPVNQNAAYYCDYLIFYLYNKQMFEYLSKTYIYILLAWNLCKIGNSIKYNIHEILELKSFVIN